MGKYLTGQGPIANNPEKSIDRPEKSIDRDPRMPRPTTAPVQSSHVRITVSRLALTQMMQSMCLGEVSAACKPFWTEFLNPVEPHEDRSAP